MLQQHIVNAAMLHARIAIEGREQCLLIEFCADAIGAVRKNAPMMIALTLFRKAQR